MILPPRLGYADRGPRRGDHGKLAPLPEALTILESEVVQPGQMLFDADELIGRVIVGGRASECGEKFEMERNGWGRHVFGVHEEATRTQDFEHLAVERALATGRAVVDREARHDHVEVAERARQALVEIVPVD